MIYTIAVGMLECNCYIVSCEGSKEALLIDPGADPERIRKVLKREGLVARAIVNTHGHADHIGANRELGLPVSIHALDAPLLGDPFRNLSALVSSPLSSPGAARLLADGDRITFGACELTVIHTPGHTPGGISLAMGNVIFSGDTLFAGGVGRTDLPSGDERALMRSIRDRLFRYDDATVVYPGHGPATTIGEERRSNPYVA